MKFPFRRAVAIAVAALAVSSSHAITQTRTSPTGGELPAAVTEIGGVVLDLKGTNGNRIVTQLAASTLFVGNTAALTVIGTQTGFTSTVLAALGGGLSAVSVRVSLYDGDQSPGDFDFDDNFLELNGVRMGNWSTPTTFETSANGLTLLNTYTGFPNNRLATGFFSSVDSTFLTSFYASLSSGSVQYTVVDIDSDTQFFDFTQGIDGSLINVGTGPVVVPPTNPIPEPETYALMGAGLAALGFVSRRRKQQKAAAK